MFRDSRFNLDTVAFIVVVCLLVAGFAWYLAQSSGTKPSTSPSVTDVLSPSPSASPDKSPGPVVKDELRITARGADSWVEVRKGGPDGDVLFSGVVDTGNTRVFVAKVLWLRLRNPADIRLRVEGQKVDLTGDDGPTTYIVKSGAVERQG